MEFNQCLGCMKHTDRFPCPHCGFDLKRQPNPEQALPLLHILHGRYLIGKMLGQGGFGITYIGWDLVLQKSVAVKEYFPGGQVSRTHQNTALTWTGTSQEIRTNGINSFIKEAQKMAQVDHIPEVTQVKEAFQENNSAYIVMDYAEGLTLKQTMDRNGVLPWKQAFPLFRRLAEVM